MMSRLGYRGGLVLALVLSGASAAWATPLDDYVNAPDSNYEWEVVATYPQNGYTDYIVHMTSQQWLTPAEVDRTLWEHYLVITKPDDVSHDTGLLLIAGGGYGMSAPVANEPLLVDLALQTQSVVAYLRQVPNQPLTFTGYHAETEDGLIAYGWRKFFEGGGPQWLMRLPMTKAAVRAMDTVTDLMGGYEGGGVTVNKFVVSGASKRGWTAWTTAAVDAASDHRVVGCVPIVIDLLNMEISFRHHFDAYGFWTPAIDDYLNNGIMDWFGTPQMKALTDIVEPYTYRHRLTMPKYVVNASGDEFFLPDSSQFYWNRLEGEKHLYYVPNTGHGGFEEQFATGLTGWYWALLNDKTRPEVTWYKRDDGSLVINIEDNGNALIAANLWKATNPDARMFIHEVYGDMYTSTPLTPVSPGKYIASVAPPVQGWSAFYAEFRFNNGGPAPLVFTTEVSVVPDVLPYGPQHSVGDAQALLDNRFYTQGGAASALVREAIGGVASNDGKRVAFWGVERQTRGAGLFVVNVGRPSSWRRVANDLPSMPTSPIVWLPDDSGVVVGQSLLVIPGPGQMAAFSPYVLHSRPADIRGMTVMPSGNWAVALSGGEALALPILRNGTEDFSRQPAYVTDLGPVGIHVADVAVAADGSVLAFGDSRPGPAGQADPGDIYTLRSLPEILAAPKRPGTVISSLAPTALEDDNLFPIRTVESGNFAGFPELSDDGSLVLFAEDWANTFRQDNPLSALPATDFDAMVSYGDGTEADVRMATTGTLAFFAPTRGGTRIAFTKPGSPTDVSRLFAMPFRTTTKASGFDPHIFLKSAVPMVVRQQFDSDGSALLDIREGVTINFPDGEGEDVWFETPVAPEEYTRVPASAESLPVVRVIGPTGTTFSKPAGVADAVSLTLKYGDAEVQGLNEDLLKVYRLDPGTGVFHELDAAKVAHDKTRNSFKVNIDALGTYAIGGSGNQDDDGDSMSNRFEATYGLDPYSPSDYNGDLDGDGLTNAQEAQAGSSPVSEDTDADGIWDDVEFRAGSDPNDPQEVPPLPQHADVDWSGATNALDVQLVINGALGRRTYCSTDINGDHRTDAADVVIVINGAMGKL